MGVYRITWRRRAQLRRAWVGTRACSVNTAAPVASGTPVVGQTLTTTDGTWAGAPTSFTYQWQRDGHGDLAYVNIAAATAATYVLVAADDGCNVRCVVTAHKAGCPDVDANSNALLVTEPIPVNTVAPVASGSAEVGQTVATTDGTWLNMGSYLPAFTYQWFRDDHGGGVYSAIGGATTNTYVLVDADDACNIRCTVTAHNTGGTADANTNVLGPVAEPAPVNVTPPAVTGSASVGSFLASTTGTWLHMGGYNPTYAYQWQSSPDGLAWSDIVGETSATLLVAAADEGLYIRSVVTATNTGGSAAADSAPVGPVTVPAVILSHANILGCGSYDAYVLTRGGGSLVAVLPWTSLDFGRVLDDTSAATVSGPAGQDSNCCAALADIRPWRHELAIYRDNVLAWVGAIYSIRTPAGTFQIEARDLTVWWDHRLVHSNIELAEVDLAVIFQAVADDAMAADPSPGLTVSTTACGVKGSRRILAAQHQLAGPALRDLTNTGIDWTAVGRQVLAGGLVIPAAPIGTFVDANFASPPTPIRDGSQQSNSRTGRGAGGGLLGDTVYATATDTTVARVDGLLEAVDSLSTVTDYPSILQHAQTQLALTRLVEQVEDCHLSPTAPFPFTALIPGALANLQLVETCLPVSGSYRLKSVSVSARAGQDDSVGLTFQPAGTTT